MRHSLVALAFSLCAALPARADLVIQGRAAQALHCAAMLYMVSEELYSAGMISSRDLDFAQKSAVLMLDYVPGTQDQKVRAMGQRFDRIMRSRSLGDLMVEFDETAPWCQKNFL
jgi:hypothetical protein